MIRNAYLRKAQRRLLDLETQMGSIEAGEEDASADPTGPLARRVYVLRNRLTVAKERLRDVRNAENGKWGPLKKAADDALDEAERALEKANRMQHGSKSSPP